MAIAIICFPEYAKQLYILYVHASIKSVCLVDTVAIQLANQLEVQCHDVTAVDEQHVRDVGFHYNDLFCCNKPSCFDRVVFLYLHYFSGQSTILAKFQSDNPCMYLNLYALVTSVLKHPKPLHAYKQLITLPW